MTFDIISTGSKGNAVVLNGCILIDCGVPFKMLQPVKKDLKLVLLTHGHSDHFKPSTVRALASERPTLRWCCRPWMAEPLILAGVDRRNIDVSLPDLVYNYPGMIDSVESVHLVHDVPNCGWNININGERAFYATDTGTLDGIEAKNYDLYLIEGNHKRAELEERLAEKEAAGVYAYERRAAVTHLSEEQAFDWLAENMGPHSRYVFLHKHEEV